MKGFEPKTIDEMGRIILPIALREELGWRPKDVISMYQVDRNTVIIQRTAIVPGETPTDVLHDDNA